MRSIHIGSTNDAPLQHQSLVADKCAISREEIYVKNLPRLQSVREDYTRMMTVIKLSLKV